MLSSLLLLTTSTDPEDRLKLAGEYSLLPPELPSTDLLTVSDPDSSIGIDQIRLVKDFFSTHPYADFKVALLCYGELLTREAQQAMLKILEEPPDFAQTIIISSHTHHFLPTILSRCQIIRGSGDVATPKSTIDVAKLLRLVTNSNHGQRIALSDDYNSDRSKAQNLTTDLIHHFRSSVKSSPSKLSLYNLTLTLYVAKLLKQNVNPKLAIDYLFFNLK